MGAVQMPKHLPNKGHPGLPEDGRITLEVRQRIKAKRLELGISTKRMALELGLNQATVTKWESGTIRKCTITTRRRLDDFLQGKYDHSFEKHWRRKLFDSYPGMVAEAELSEAAGQYRQPADLEILLKRVAVIYNLCNKHPDLQNEVADGLRFLADSALSKLHERSKA